MRFHPGPVVFTSLALLWLGGCSDDSSTGDASVDAGGDLAADVAAPDLLPPCVHPTVTKSCANGWCQIPAGCYHMGSPPDEPCRTADERQVQVTLTHGFEIQAMEVTQGDFAKLMGRNPSYSKTCGADCPVEEVTWHDAAAYCNALSAGAGLKPCYRCNQDPVADGGVDGGADPSRLRCDVSPDYTGQRGAIYGCPGYRLPTEAEWEYAYRAGTATALYTGAITSCTGTDANADTAGWYLGNAGQRYYPGGKKAANAWGLYDMAGNLWEWCHDRLERPREVDAFVDPEGAQGDQRAQRGGSWTFEPRSLRGAARLEQPISRRSMNAGFRCVRRAP